MSDFNGVSDSAAVKAAEPEAAEFRKRELPPHNYIALSIIFLGFCSPFALISLYFGAQVNRFFVNYQDEKAQKASSRALLWCWISALWVIFLFFSCAALVTKMAEIVQSWSNVQ